MSLADFKSIKAKARLINTDLGYDAQLVGTTPEKEEIVEILPTAVDSEITVVIKARSNKIFSNILITKATIQSLKKNGSILLLNAHANIKYDPGVTAREKLYFLRFMDPKDAMQQLEDCVTELYKE